MNNTATVGIGELKLIHGVGMLRAIAIGSCIALCLYDSICANGVMAHVFLPSCRLAHRAADHPAAYYADTAVYAALEMMICAGSARGNVIAAMIGGAQMFPFGNIPAMNVGQLNIEAVQLQLKRLEIPLVYTRLGGNKARTVSFSVPGNDLASQIVC